MRSWTRSGQSGCLLWRAAHQERALRLNFFFSSPSLLHQLHHLSSSNVPASASHHWLNHFLWLLDHLILCSGTSSSDRTKSKPERDPEVICSLCRKGKGESGFGRVWLAWLDETGQGGGWISSLSILNLQLHSDRRFDPEIWTWWVSRLRSRNSWRIPFGFASAFILSPLDWSLSHKLDDLCFHLDWPLLSSSLLSLLLFPHLRVLLANTSLLSQSSLISNSSSDSTFTLLRTLLNLATIWIRIIELVVLSSLFFGSIRIGFKVVLGRKKAEGRETEMVRRESMQSIWNIWLSCRDPHP